MSLVEVEPGIVLLGMVEQLDAAMTDSDKPAGYQADVFANVLAHVNGRLLPQF